MALASAVEGARHTAQQITWTDEDGTAVDLTGATITGRKRDLNTKEVTTLDGNLVIADATNGVFSWTYGTDDVADPGVYMVQFIATFGDGSKDKTLQHSWTVYDALDE